MGRYHTSRGHPGCLWPFCFPETSYLASLPLLGDRSSVAVCLPSVTLVCDNRLRSAAFVHNRLRVRVHHTQPRCTPTMKDERVFTPQFRLHSSRNPYSTSTRRQVISPVRVYPRDVMTAIDSDIFQGFRVADTVFPLRGLPEVRGLLWHRSYPALMSGKGPNSPSSCSSHTRDGWVYFDPK